MLKYKYVQAANGRDMYYMNGKMVSKSKIPADILPRLEEGVELQMGSQEPVEEQEELETVDGAPDHTVKLSKSEDRDTCIFCGEPATRQRYINQQNAKLCDDDYSSHTTGEIAAQMREVENET